MASANKVLTLTGDQLKHCIASFARECFSPETTINLTKRYVPAKDSQRGDILNRSRAEVAIRNLLRTPFDARMNAGGKLSNLVQFKAWQMLWDLHGEVDLTACYGVHVQWWPTLTYRLSEGSWPLCIHKPDPKFQLYLMQKTRNLTLSDNPPDAPDLERWLGAYFDDRLGTLS